MARSLHRPTLTDRRGRRDVGCRPDLADRTRAGDRQAFDELYRLTVNRVTAYVAVRLRDRDQHAIDDLVQDTYCTALADPTLIGADNIGSLLRLAARACARHRWSRNRYIRAAYAVYEDRQAPQPQPLEHERPAAPNALGRMPFVHALARLTADQRRAIQLRLLDGYPYAAAADAMGKSIDAVRSLERRGLRQLHRQLTDTGTAMSASAHSAR